MSIDYPAAENFLWSAARLVDRHRYAMLFAAGSADPVVAALRAYQNPDGGFGHGLEPDLRCPDSQPAPTLYALEILHEAGRLDGPEGRAARAWIASVADAAGAVPQALPGFEAYPHSPWWSAEPESMLTFGLAAALHAGAVTGEEWLARASDWCWRSIEATEHPGGYWLKYALAYLDAVPDEQRARAAIASLAERVDVTVVAPVGGAEGETLRPLDLAPTPGSRSRRLIGEASIQAHLDAVEREQRDDGGWMFDWLAWSPAQTNDWRGIVTIRALRWLRDHGRLK